MGMAEPLVEKDGSQFNFRNYENLTDSELIQKGMLVDNKAFTGQHITIEGRGTFVLVKQNTWKIVHYHLDKISN